MLGKRGVKKVELRLEALTVLQSFTKCFKQFLKIHSKASVLKSLFNKVAGLMVCNFIKRKKL